MANIFNDSSAFLNQSTGNGNFTNLISQNAVFQNTATDNLTIDNSLSLTTLNAGDILISGNLGVIDGLNIGINNDVLVSNGSAPLWTNSLTIDNLQTNTLKIPTTTTGDLIVMNSNSEATRLLIGASGTFLISDGVEPQWEPLPNPLILGGLEVNDNFKLTNFPNRTLLTDNTGFITSEQPQLKLGGPFSLNTITSQFYGVAEWSMTSGCWYEIRLNITCLDPVAFYGYINVNASTIGYYNYLGSHFETVGGVYLYEYTGATSNSVGISVYGASVSATNLASFEIYVEKKPNPVLKI